MRYILDNIDLRPKLCVWEITSKCNMRCLHCASDFYGPRKRGAELTTDEALDLCRQLAELGCEKVVLSGGEAILRSDWMQIAGCLSNLGVATSVITNGYAFDAKIAKRVHDLGMARVGLSLDGLRDNHNLVRQNPASFDRVLRAATYIRDTGVPLNIVTHINKKNLSELEALEALVVSMGAAVWRLQLGSPMGSLEQHPELMLHPDDLPGIVDFVVEAKQRWRTAISVGDNIGYFSNHEEALRATPNRDGFNFWCGCSAGCLTIGIEANGNVKGCLSLQSDNFVEGNIRESSLAELWHRPGAFAYTRGFEIGNLKGYCQGCELGEVCRGGCTFMAYGATGSAHNNPFCMYGLHKRSVAIESTP